MKNLLQIQYEQKPLTIQSQANLRFSDENPNTLQMD
jgi:hypothetical protein